MPILANELWQLHRAMQLSHIQFWQIIAMKQAVIVGLKTMSYECTVFAVLPLHLPLKSHWQGAIITNFVCDHVFMLRWWAWLIIVVLSSLVGFAPVTEEP